ncbi:cytochrome c3 family protein [Shewanella avicenniae]|uniref:Cytochrome c3 family protein n=1 Tax=Shewanella avicenniae TaxID=2814294 RepID=A0ABX7QTA1_9GAMM|nr:cytochrome c3 family protein [Shewanella avicenniae]QSX34489.1 cytochrome c3 family protein [Shewanella avicenniae]
MKNFKLFNIVLAAALTVFAGSTMAKGDTLLDQTHFAKGIKCASCHGDATPREAVPMTKCQKCHNPEKLAQKTKDMKPTNVHNNRHEGTQTDCAKCHQVHQPSKNSCIACHPRFDFKVP